MCPVLGVTSIHLDMLLVYVDLTSLISLSMAKEPIQQQERTNLSKTYLALRQRGSSLAGQSNRDPPGNPSVLQRDVVVRDRLTVFSQTLREN